MKIYLAARYSHRERLVELRDTMTQFDIEVTSRWLDGNHRIVEIPAVGEMHVDGAAMNNQFAFEDLADIDRADIVVAFTEPSVLGGDPAGRNRGGRHVELGYAIASGKQVVVVGPHENVFCWLNSVVHLNSILELGMWLSRRHADKAAGRWTEPRRFV